MNATIARTGLFALLLLISTAVLADKRHDSAAPQAAYFTDDRVRIIRDYYAKNRNTKACPPGLAKKGNGCQPPGQAKKWRRGDHLPQDYVYYDIPVSLSRELGEIPAGQKIVRVGTDLLMIAIGTGLVIDALDDLNDVL